MIRVLIADDHQLVRDGYRVLLRSDPEIEVVGEAKDGFEAVELTKQLVPDVILMDIRMPGQSGLDALKQIRELPVNTYVILISMVSDEFIIRKALRDGASAYFSKNINYSMLTSGVRAVWEGNALPGADGFCIAPPIRGASQNANSSLESDHG